MKDRLYDWWIKVKVKLNLPLPISTFYYKGRKLVMWKNWFCSSCKARFDNMEWKNNPDKLLSEYEMKCPNCGSNSIMHSDELSKAIIDKQSDEKLLEIISTFR